MSAALPPPERRAPEHLAIISRYKTRVSVEFSRAFPADFQLWRTLKFLRYTKSIPAIFKRRMTKIRSKKSHKLSMNNLYRL
jgi:hypothetical protein